MKNVQARMPYPDPVVNGTLSIKLVASYRENISNFLATIYGSLVFWIAKGDSHRTRVLEDCV